jgi:hypothetical protein
VAVKLVRLGALLGIVVVLAVLGWEDRLFGLFSWRMLAAILAAQPAMIGAQVLIGLRLSRAVGKRQLGVPRALRATLLGQLSDLFLPWRLSEFVRVAYLGERAAVPLSDAFAGVLFERVADLAVVAIVAVAFAGTALSASSWGAIALAALLLAGMLALPRLDAPAAAILRLLPEGGPRSFLERLLGAVILRVRERVFLRVLLPSGGAWLLSIAAAWIYLHLAVAAVGGASGMLTAVAVVGIFLATTLGIATAVLPAGLGTYEAAVVLVLSGYGFALEQSIVLAVGLHVSQVLIAVLGGFFVVWSEPTGLAAIAAQVRGLAKKRAGWRSARNP